MFDTRARTLLPFLNASPLVEGYKALLSLFKSVAWEEFTGYQRELLPARGRFLAGVDVELSKRKQKWLDAAIQAAAKIRDAESGRDAHSHPGELKQPDAPAQAVKPSGANWEDIELTFIGDFDVEILVHGKKVCGRGRSLVSPGDVSARTMLISGSAYTEG